MILQRQGQRVDISGMIDFEWKELERCEGWKSVLAAYDDAHEAPEQNDDESDGWLSRIRAVDGVEFEDLPRIHGKLISLGLLKFQLANRTLGMRYQLSGSGKRALGTNSAPSANADSDTELPAETTIELA